MDAVSRQPIDTRPVCGYSPSPEIPPENSCPLLDRIDRLARGRICSFLPYEDLRSLRATCSTSRIDVFSHLMNQLDVPPLDKENKERFCTRLSTILEALQENPALNLQEKAFFRPLLSDALFEDHSSLYLVLDVAYKSSLVALFLSRSSFEENASLEQKVTCVREYIQKHKKTITALRCKGRGITCFPEELCEFLPNLQTLDLENNSLCSLPVSIGTLSALQTLDLENNSLCSLPHSFGSLSALQYLFLNDNSLCFLPDSFGSLSALQNLSLNNNGLCLLPVSIGSLSALRTLWLSNTSLLEGFPESFRQGLLLL